MLFILFCRDIFLCLLSVPYRFEPAAIGPTGSNHPKNISWFIVELRRSVIINSKFISYEHFSWLSFVVSIGE